MPTFAGRTFLAFSLCLLTTGVAWSQAAPNNKEFDDYTQVERDAAKAAARKAHFSSFKVCGDPGNMPYSNNKQEGFDNKIADVISKALGTTTSYFWRPSIERGTTRQTFETHDCDIFMSVPYNYSDNLTTFPIYKTTYVIASRTDRHYDFKDLADPRLRKLKIGVYETSALRQSLANHGAVANMQVFTVSPDGDLNIQHQPWWQAKQVVDGELDAAAIWGPFAGWLKSQGAPLTLTPTNLMDDVVPMEFEIAIGVRKTDAVTKYAIENALNKHRDEIEKILQSYGVPLVECAECLITGPIKAHGVYTRPTYTPEEIARMRQQSNKIARAKLDEWLKDGADVNEEFANAVLATDTQRMTYLLGKGADINKTDAQGYTPLTSALRLGSVDAMNFLLEHGAKVDVPDRDGWAPILHAALRNNPSMIDALVKRGAGVETRAPGGFTPLAIALEEKKFDAANALIDRGANVNEAVGKKKITPLMVAASERPPENRSQRLLQKLDSISIARELLKHGADANAKTTDGATPLMIAAARDNAPMIGLLLQSGAKPDAKNIEGDTAYNIALKNENGSALRLLQVFANTDSR